MANALLKIFTLLIVIAVILVGLRIPAWLRSVDLVSSAWAAAFWFALLALVVIGAAWLAYRRFFPAPRDVTDFAQGFAAIVTVVAIFIASGIYFLERRDRPRLTPTLNINAIRLPTAERAPAQVLLAVRLGIRNEGERRVVIGCSSMALEGVKQGQEVRRASPDDEELAFHPIAEPVNYRPGQSCNTAEDDRRQWPRGTVKPLYRWQLPLALEPDETADRYFEIPVGCDLALLRVLAKFRINPEDRLGYEIKDTISITKVCAGDRDVATGLADSLAADSKSDAVPAAAAPAASENKS